MNNFNNLNSAEEANSLAYRNLIVSIENMGINLQSMLDAQKYYKEGEKTTEEAMNLLRRIVFLLENK